MASTAMKLSLFLFLSLSAFLLSSAHARDSQFFNKIPSTTNNVVVPTATKEIPTNRQEPNFLPENENSYGLYGHETGQDPPSAAAATTTTTTTTPAAEFKQPVNKYLPKNYNPVAYVTQPENANEGTEFTEERSFSNNPDAANTDNKSNYYNGEENFYKNQQHEDEEAAEFRGYPTTTPAAANDRDTGAGNYYYGAGSSFNSQPQGQRNAFNNRGGGATSQPQGMSDTRYMENGKYFYDLNSEKYSSNHPYESLRGARPQNEFNNRNFYANNAQNEFNTRNFNGNNAQNEFNNRNFNGNNAYDFSGENSVGGYRNQEEFENMP